MSDSLPAQLAALIVKWRTEGHRPTASSVMGFRAVALLECADQLAALLDAARRDREEHDAHQQREYDPLP